MKLGPFPLPPGDTPLWFTTAEPPWVESGSSARPLAFAVYDLDPGIFTPPAPPP